MANTEPRADIAGAGALIEVHTPLPDTLHASAGPSHGVSQHTPSAQKPDEHWLGSVQAPPGIPVCVGVTEGVAVGVSVGVAVLDAVNVALAVGVIVGVRVAGQMAQAFSAPPKHSAPTGH